MILNINVWFDNSFENVIKYYSILSKKLGDRNVFWFQKFNSP